MNKDRIRQKRAKDAWHKAKNRAYRDIAKQQQLSDWEKHQAKENWNWKNAYSYDYE